MLTLRNSVGTQWGAPPEGTRKHRGAPLTPKPSKRRKKPFLKIVLYNTYRPSPPAPPALRLPNRARLVNGKHAISLYMTYAMYQQAHQRCYHWQHRHACMQLIFWISVTVYLHLLCLPQAGGVRAVLTLGRSPSHTNMPVQLCAFLCLSR